MQRAHGIIRVHMKYNQLIVAVTILANVACASFARAGATDENSTSAQRIGVYDSRVVAYAHFWAPEQQMQLKEKADLAKAAKSAGDTAQFNKLSKEMSDLQEKLHRQVFSTAPADEAMTALKPRLTEIQKQASVSELVSKWDKQALRSYKSEQQVDVTDLLVREFKLDPKQMKTIEEIKKQKPVALDKMDQMHND
jgi:ribosomal protein L3